MMEYMDNGIDNLIILEFVQLLLLSTGLHWQSGHYSVINTWLDCFFTFCCTWLDWFTGMCSHQSGEKATLKQRSWMAATSFHAQYLQLVLQFHWCSYHQTAKSYSCSKPIWLIEFTVKENKLLRWNDRKLQQLPNTRVNNTN